MRHAGECVRLAGLTDDPSVRNQLMELAQDWIAAAQRKRPSSEALHDKGDDARVVSLRGDSDDATVVQLRDDKSKDDFRPMVETLSSGSRRRVIGMPTSSSACRSAMLLRASSFREADPSPIAAASNCRTEASAIRVCGP